MPALLLGSAPGRAQAALVCSLASDERFPSLHLASGRRCHRPLPRPTNRSELLLACRGAEMALPGARQGADPKALITVPQPAFT